MPRLLYFIESTKQVGTNLVVKHTNKIVPSVTYRQLYVYSDLRGPIVIGHRGCCHIFGTEIDLCDFKNFFSKRLKIIVYYLLDLFLIFYDFTHGFLVVRVGAINLQKCINYLSRLVHELVFWCWEHF